MPTLDELNLPIDSLVQQTGKQGRREADEFRNYLKNLTDKGWMRQSFCTDWSIRDVALHQAAQGAIFRDNARALLQGEPPLDIRQVSSQYEAELQDLNPSELADRIAETTYELYELLENATPEQLRNKVRVPFGDVNLAAMGSIRLSELSLHSWDVRVVDNLSAKVSRDSMPLLFPGLLAAIPLLANSEVVKQTEHLTYQFELEGTVRGPVAVSLEGGQIKVQQDYVDDPDVRIKLDNDSFLRLSWGRLKNLDKRIKDGWVKVDGDPKVAITLNELFKGR
jgi:uncharacterized protein (TIGR03083 family)